MSAQDLHQRQLELAEAVAEHSRLARQAGQRWYGPAAVKAAYARVQAARHGLHPWTLAGDYGAAHELEFYGGGQR